MTPNFAFDLVLIRTHAVASVTIIAMSSPGRQHSASVAEDSQENRARGGVEEDPGGPEGHGGPAPAARGQSQRSFERGEARSPAALRLSGTNASRAAKERDEKPLSAYKCQWGKKKKKEQLCPFSGYDVAKKKKTPAVVVLSFEVFNLLLL